MAIHECDHSAQADVKRILTQLRQIDESRGRFEQRPGPQRLLDEVIVRSKYRQWRFQALEPFLDGVRADRSERRAGIALPEPVL